MLQHPLRLLSLAVVLVCPTLVGGVASAAPWRGITPGVSTRQDVIARFGEPSRTARVKDREVLTYLGGRAPKLTDQVQFRFGESHLVERVDVYPRTVIRKQVIEGNYGSRCSGSADPSADPCYVSKLTEEGTSYLAYPSLGIAIFLRGDGDTVFDLVFAKGTKMAPPAGTNKEVPIPEPTGERPSEAGGENSASTPGFAQKIEASLPEDILKIGGILYLRGALSLQDSPVTANNVSFSAPNLLDIYLDGRPNDRVRGFVLGRMFYDPTTNPYQSVSALGLAEPPQPNPNILLDQFWLKFDIARTVFVTVGRQHVKWGTSKLWSPVDFLSPIKLDPFALYDVRVGTDMVRVNLPLESQAVNLYGVGFVDSLGMPSDPIRIGAAARAEIVLFGAELALSAVAQQQRKPQYGFDFSSAVGNLPLDVYGELALRRDTDHPLWGLAANPDPLAGYAGTFQRISPPLPFVQASAGLIWTHPSGEGASLAIGGEGFYDGAGYSDERLLPWLMIQNDYTSLYTGRYYAAAFAQYSNGRIVDGLTLGLYGVANLSDGSVVGRLNATLKVLTELMVDASVGVPLGAVGEFNFQAHIPSFTLGSQSIGPIDVWAQRLFVQLGLRIRI